MLVRGSAVHQAALAVGAAAKQPGTAVGWLSPEAAEAVEHSGFDVAPIYVTTRPDGTIAAVVEGDDVEADAVARQKAAAAKVADMMASSAVAAVAARARRRAAEREAAGVAEAEAAEATARGEEGEEAEEAAPERVAGGYHQLRLRRTGRSGPASSVADDDSDDEGGGTSGSTALPQPADFFGRGSRRAAHTALRPYISKSAVAHCVAPGEFCKLAVMSFGAALPCHPAKPWSHGAVLTAACGA